MKKHIFYTLFAGLFAVLASSCTKENTNNLAYKQITLTSDFTATRTSLNGHTLSWSEGDTYGIFAVDAAGNNLGYTQSPSYNPQIKEYTISVPEATASLFCVYPHSTRYYSTDLADVQVFIEPAQDGTFSASNHIMAAKVEIPASNKANVVFTPLVSIVEFNIYNTAGGNEESLRKIYLNTDESCAGWMHIDFTADELRLEGAEETVATSTVESEEAVVGADKSAGTKAYLIVAKGNYEAEAMVGSGNLSGIYSLPGLNLEADGRTVNIDLSKANRGLYIPDDNFRKFCIENFDANNDRLLTKNELESVKSLHLDNLTIYTLEGIEYFTSLTYLYCCVLNSLDVSQNKALKTLICPHGGLKTLDVSKNTELEVLHCHFNLLESLNVSGCKNLKELYCYFNYLQQLDVSECSSLQTLQCYSNYAIITLDVSKNTALRELDCSNDGLTMLDISGCPELRTLECGHNWLTTLDISNNTALETLGCSANQLTELDLSKHTAITSLDCSWNLLTTLDVSKTNLDGGYLACDHMDTLETLYLLSWWTIVPLFIPEHTKIIFADKLS